LGKHQNRARVYDINGIFRTTLTTVEAEKWLDSGDAIRTSRPNERPLRIVLMVARQWQPKPYSPTSGCTSSACITAREAELNALGSTHLTAGQDRAALKRVQAKICANEPCEQEEKTWD
jgi:hypothetical protein